MATLIYSAIGSLDGYVAEEEGKFDWAEPDEQVHAFRQRPRAHGRHLPLGRRTYETMAGWETDATLAARSQLMRDYAEIWRATDKVVYSKTLETAPTRRTRIDRDFDPEAVQHMKPQPERTWRWAAPTSPPTPSRPDRRMPPVHRARHRRRG